MSKLEGFLEKRGYNALTSGWKRRWFELEGTKLYYYDLYDDVKEYKGVIDVMAVTRCAPLELDSATQTPLSKEEGWRFFIDTPTRRYDLRSLDGEYKMWYWIEGIRNVQAKTSQRMLSRELEESKLRRSREVNEYVFEDLQIHLSAVKERLNQEENEKKNLLNELKRAKYLHKKELQTKEKELISLRGQTPSSSNAISASPLIEDETKELFEMLQAAEKQISDLRLKLTDQERESKTTLTELQKIRDQQDLHRRRLENEVADLRQKLELETTTKNALQMNNRELDKELQQMHRLMQSRNAGPPWVPDWFVEACTGCKAAFTVFRRRHHCRQCGNIFCSKCSGMTAMIPSGFYPNARVRVCNGCYAAILARIATNTPNSFPTSV